MTDQEFASQIAESLDEAFVKKYGKWVVERAVLLIAHRIPWDWRQIMLEVADGIDPQEKAEWVEEITKTLDGFIQVGPFLEPFDDDFIRPVVERVFAYLEEGVSL